MTEWSEEDGRQALRVIARLRDKNEVMRGLIEDACAFMECWEYCPFWTSRSEPCRAQAVMRRD